MKSILAGLMATLATAGAALAGTPVYVPPAVTVVDEPMRSGSGAWLIPLAIIAILALTLTGDDSNEG
ncbi:hypothetical protein LGT41_0000330 [Abyssibius alkaniclasticus]|uniref:hypothetical protein n=1 Tax=Abyssibius alkaniclasticus TaxID=2881234 RepID=UPI002363B87E|nr:hypothetical protein [Abyssibius alkaniclasticus]UPH71295.1 hypothetical protein LGT41_0000330 [Abyssibius alkaniclasticus]